MDRLWAPWRVTYVRSKKQRGCIFCAAVKSKGREGVLFKSRHAFVMLNAFPYNNGHLMVSPLRHVGDMTRLTDAQLLDLWKTVSKAKRILERVLKPDGYNIGINMGPASGAGIAGHLHVHIVPRWKGDTNFMPVIGKTKVISQSLDELRRLLRKVL